MKKKNLILGGSKVLVQHRTTSWRKLIPYQKQSKVLILEGANLYRKKILAPRGNKVLV